MNKLNHEFLIEQPLYRLLPFKLKIYRATFHKQNLIQRVSWYKTVTLENILNRKTVHCTRVGVFVTTEVFF